MYEYYFLFVLIVGILANLLILVSEWGENRSRPK